MDIIADSSALVSLASPQDSNNKKAESISSNYKSIRKVMTIPAEVFSETINILGKKTNHAAATKFAKYTLALDVFSVQDSDDEIRSLALTKLEKQPESVSFTDCLVMAFADKYKTKEIFGFDEAFAKNGYKLPGAS